MKLQSASYPLLSISATFHQQIMIKYRRELIVQLSLQKQDLR